MSNPILAPTFIIGQIKVGSVEGASCINVGNNYPAGFMSHKKQNQGLAVSGDHNQFKEVEAMLENANAVELIGSQGEDAFPEWLRHLIEKYGTEE